MSFSNRSKRSSNGYGYERRDRNESGHNHQRTMSSKELAMSQINPNGPPIELDEDFFSVMFGKVNMSDMFTGRYPMPSMDATSTFDVEEEINSSASNPVKCEIGIKEFETEATKLRKPFQSLRVPKTLHITPFAVESYPGDSHPDRVYFDHDLDLTVTNEVPIKPDLDNESHLQSEVTKEGVLNGVDETLTIYDIGILTSRGIDKVDSVRRRNSIHQDYGRSLTAADEKFKFERRSDKEQKAGKLVASILDSKEYQSSKESYFDKFQIGLGFKPPADYTQFSPRQMNFFNLCMSFDEKQLVIPACDAKKLKFVYLPSGGGKSTLKKVSRFKSLYVDVDELIADHYEEFEMFDKLLTNGEDPSVMNKFFKYLIYINVYRLYDKITLMNHPNQIPNVFRLGFNELILLPVFPRWGLRYFNNNFISLLSVLDKVKVLCSYSSYERVIGRYFGIRMS